MEAELIPPGLPLDVDGFPTALRRIRHEVTKRGGKIAPDGHRWVIYHDDPTLTRTYLYFHHDGWVEIGVTRHCVFLRSPDDAYSTGTEDGSLTELEAEVFDILNGGFSEYILLETGNVFRGAGFHLESPPPREMPSVSHEEGLRVVWWTYPAWPQSKH